MARIKVPEQFVELTPASHPGRWTGFIRIEAYDDPNTVELIEDLHCLAECGGPLRTHHFPDGTEVYLAVMPRGR